MLSKQDIVYFVGKCLSQVHGHVLNMNSRGPNMLSVQKGGLKLELGCKPLLKMGKSMLCSVRRVVWRCQELVTFCTVAFNHLGDGPLLTFSFYIQNRGGERRGILYLLLITSHLCSSLLHFGKHLLALLKPNITVIPVVHFTYPLPVMNLVGRMQSVIFLS